MSGRGGKRWRLVALPLLAACGIDDRQFDAEADESDVGAIDGAQGGSAASEAAGSGTAYGVNGGTSGMNGVKTTNEGGPVPSGGAGGASSDEPANATGSGGADPGGSGGAGGASGPVPDGSPAELEASAQFYDFDIVQGGAPAFFDWTITNVGGQVSEPLALVYCVEQ